MHVIECMQQHDRKIQLYIFIVNAIFFYWNLKLDAWMVTIDYNVTTLKIVCDEIFFRCIMNLFTDICAVWDINLSLMVVWRKKKYASINFCLV